jgi:hypothetical protein
MLPRTPAQADFCLIVRPDLDSQGASDVLRQDTSTAANAHEIIHILQKNGPTAYGLVMLIVVLQDTALNASKTASVLVMSQGISGDHREANLIVLGTASTSCRDIAELLLHATLRMIDAEEDLVRRMTSSRQ